MTAFQKWVEALRARIDHLAERVARLERLAERARIDDLSERVGRLERAADTKEEYDQEQMDQKD